MLLGAGHALFSEDDGSIVTAFELHCECGCRALLTEAGTRLRPVDFGYRDDTTGARYRPLVPRRDDSEGEC
jgi:hypothetical protein